MNRILADFAPIRFATCGRAALKLARECVPDLVLLDVEMPDLNGFDVCSAFKDDPALAQVPIIFITSHDSAEIEAKGLALGGADFLRKPPHASLVLARVRTYQRLKMLSDTVRTAVTMDFLTGAVTRRCLEKSLTQEWLRTQRSAAALSLLLIDIDGFTLYNQEFGEAAADALLKSIAGALLRAAQRPGDLLGRWAGGRFALMLPGTGAIGARLVAQRAIQAVEALQIPRYTKRESDCRVSVHAGGSSREPASATATAPEELIVVAERALVQAASAGAPDRAIIQSLDRVNASGPRESRSTGGHR